MSIISSSSKGVDTEKIDTIQLSSSYVDDYIHRRSRTFGVASSPTSTHWSDEDSLTSFQAISGNNSYGSDEDDEASIFGSDDTPFIEGQVKFNPGYILITSVSNSGEYIIRLVWSNTTLQDGIDNNQYSTIPFKYDSFIVPTWDKVSQPVNSALILLPIGNVKIDVGTKVWIQLKSNVDNANINFYINAHGFNY